MNSYSNSANSNNKKYYRIREIVEILGVAQSTLYQWQREGRFPAPALRPSARLCLYSSEQIDVWLQQQAEAVK